MRSGAAAGHRGYFHEAALYGSDDDFLSIVIPFLRGGVDAREPTIVALEPRHADLVRRAFPDARLLTFLEASHCYARPASALKSYRELLARHVSDGAEQVRIVGELPDPGTRVPWQPWARYEAAVNHVLDDFPLWGLCPYDVRGTPDEVLTDVERTHPWLALPGGGHRPNPLFEDPVTLLTTQTFDHVEPTERLGPATVELLPSSPEVARDVATRLSAEAGLDMSCTDALVLAVSETVTNALRHGTPPTRLRVWREPGRVVVTVTDAGKGPADPFAGLIPAHDNPAKGGLGLWIVHQMCDQVTMHRHEDGFTIVLVAGEHRR